MSVGAYAGFVVFTLLLASGIRWFDPAATAQLARRSGVSGTLGWVSLLVGSLWLYLPVLAGANLGDDRLWAIGAGLGGLGVFLCLVALTSLDEYRLLTAADHREPEATSVGVEPSVTATSGVPTVPDDEDGQSPILDLPSVYTDWLVQRRTRVGSRRGWKTITGGVEQTPFTLGDGAVAVDADQYRVFSAARGTRTFDPDEPLPEPVGDFFESHADLPQPTARTNRIKVVESYIPADEPVTVVGTPQQGARPGTVEIEAAPPDRVVTSPSSSPPESLSAGDPVLIRGADDAATERIRRRVYWLGGIGLLLTVGGQALAFWLSSASLAGLL